MAPGLIDSNQAGARPRSTESRGTLPEWRDFGGKTSGTTRAPADSHERWRPAPVRRLRLGRRRARGLCGSPRRRARARARATAAAAQADRRPEGAKAAAAVDERRRVATTTAAALDANNTSASSLFVDSYTPATRFHGSSSTPASNGDALPGSVDAASLGIGRVSKVDIHTLVVRSRCSSRPRAGSAPRPVPARHQRVERPMRRSRRHRLRDQLHGAGQEAGRRHARPRPRRRNHRLERTERRPRRRRRALDERRRDQHRRHYPLQARGRGLQWRVPVRDLGGRGPRACARRPAAT